jgi:putative ABC transport system permease protein
MFTTTIRILLARRFRLVTTGLAVLLGVSFMAGALTLTDTVGRSFNRLYAQVYAGTDALVRSSSTAGPSGMELRGTVPASTVGTIEHVHGVAFASGLSQGYAQLLGKDGKPLANAKRAPSIGFTWIPDKRLNPFRISQGQAPTADDEIVIDRASAKAAGYHVGDHATVLSEAAPQRMQIVGIATFSTADSPAGAGAVLFTTRAAQQLIGQPDRFDAVVVVAKPGVTQAQTAARIRRVMPAGVEVLTGGAVTAEAEKSGRRMLTQFNEFLLAFALISLFVGSFVIYNTFSILVAQRSREHALLRAIGASRRQILVAVVMESLAVGAIAVAAGIAVGMLVASGLKALLGGFGISVPAGRLVLSSSTVAVSALTGLGVTVAAAVFPARRAAKVAPVAAMRESEVETATGLRGRVISGLALAIAGAAFIATGLAGHSHNALKDVSLGGLGVFVGVAMLAPLVAAPLSRLLGAPLIRLRGVPGRLGRDNAMRNPRRTAATAASLMIGVALVGVLTVFASSAKRSYNDSVNSSIKANFVVSGGAMEQGGYPRELARSVAQAPGIKVATGYRTTTVELGTSSKQAASVPLTTWRSTTCE